MTALVTTHRAQGLRPRQKWLARLGRSLLILYWSAGLLLILPFALGFWAIGATVRAGLRWRAQPPAPRSRR